MFFARIMIFVQNFNQKENYFFIYFACKSKSLLIYLNTLTFFMCSKSGISLNRIDKNKEKKGENYGKKFQEKTAVYCGCADCFACVGNACFCLVRNGKNVHAYV